MPYSAKAVANTLLDFANENCLSICPLRMQKLVYLAHGWYLANKYEPLISEPIEVWQYGPVVSSIYHEFKSFGSRPIESRALIREFNSETKRFEVEKPTVSDGFARELIKIVLVGYDKYSPIQLSNYTHAEDSPWTKAVKSGDKHINNNNIMEYFCKILENENNN